MDKAYLNTLKNRRDELLKELGSINSILQLYSEDPLPVENEGRKLTRTKFTTSKTIKGRIIDIIKDLGGQAYMAQITEELKKQLPTKDPKNISNTARNYVHMLKNDGILEGKFIENNKWLYTLLK